MTTKKSIGIWMDHSSANLMEVTNAPMETKTIEATFSHEVKQESLTKGEHVMHNKEQQQQAGYYKQLGAVIQNYDNVLLFGPTNAKTELRNLLHADHAFSKITIDVKDSDKMTENQQHAFVKEHFSK